MRNIASYPIAFSLVLTGSVLVPSQKVTAQIVPDDTLGTENSIVIPDVTINGMPAERIEGGAVRGEILFHSFKDFNIAEGHGGYFLNPEGTNTIFSRVTGSNQSDILGTLGVLGSTDLVFLNPNGILFGPNAQLDLKGSFTASTASEVAFLNNKTFSVSEPGLPSLLTMNMEAPIGLLFEDIDSASIVNEGVLVAGENLTLSANNLDLQGQLYANGELTFQAQDTITIRDSENAPFIAAASGQLTVQGNQEVDIVVLNHPNSGLLSGGNMTFRSANAVNGDAHYWSGGNFQVETLDENIGDLFSPIDPIIRALGDVTIGIYQGSSLHILAGGSVDIGTAVINTPDIGTAGVDFLQETIELSDGTSLEIDGSIQPTLDIRAGVALGEIGVIPTDNVSGVNPTMDFFLNEEIQLATPDISDIPTSADITIGDVVFNSGNGLVLLTNQYEQNSALAGSIFVTGDGFFGEGIDARGRDFIGGQGGAVYLDSRDDVAVINSFINTAGVGIVGDIVINAESTVRFDRQDKRTVATSNLVSGDTLLEENKGGNVLINADTLEVLNGAQLLANTYGDGDAGNVVINARNRVRFDGESIDSQFPSAAFSSVEFGATGTGGNVVINTDTLEVLNGARIVSATFGTGDAGNVEISARDRIVLDNGGAAFSSVEMGAAGIGGNILIVTDTLEALNGGQLSASTSGNGNAGNVEITARDHVLFDDGGVFSDVDSEAVGIGGSVVITTGTLEMINGSRLVASTSGRGDAGNVEITARNHVLFDDASVAQSRINRGATGIGGDVEITADTVEVLNGSQVLANSRGNGNAGNVEIAARNRIRFDGTSADDQFPSAAFSSVETGAIGTGGNVLITADTVEMLNGARLSAATFGTGDAGNIIITSNVLEVLNGVQLVAATSGTGDAGNVEIAARDHARFMGTSAVFSSVLDLEATGIGGDVVIVSDVLEVLDGSQILANTSGNGDAGDVLITTPNYVQFDSGAVFSGVDSEANGAGGNVVINAGSVEMLNGSQIVAATEGNGDAGNVVITAQQRVTLQGTNSSGRPSAVFVNSDESATGQGSNIRLTTPILQVQNGAALFASTANEQTGGDIVLSLGRLTVLDGGQIVTSSLSSGAAGTLKIDANEGIQVSGSDPTFSSRSAQVSETNLLFVPQSRLSVQSRATGAAGNIVIGAAGTTPSVLLDNGGQINAESAAVDGGNISLSLTGPLLLRNGSSISATAGTSQTGGNGGNVVLDVGSIFAVSQENSDITANAFEGNGGRVEISANGLFGISFRDDPTSLSDITASSEQGNSGNVNINTPEIDPTQGLTGLPEEPRETAITDSCQTATTQGSVAFFDLGRGGAPPNPDDTIDSNAIGNWISLDLSELNDSVENIVGEVEEENITYSTNTYDTTPSALITACAVE